MTLSTVRLKNKMTANDYVSANQNFHVGKQLQSNFTRGICAQTTQPNVFFLNSIMSSFHQCHRIYESFSLPMPQIQLLLTPPPCQLKSTQIQVCFFSSSCHHQTRLILLSSLATFSGK